MTGRLQESRKSPGPIWRRLAVISALALAFFALSPGMAWAQSGIAGVVKDSSGAVLPGVTVEAASPALIEKTRTVVSDGEGRYSIVDLRPGTYTVTFSLEGFNTVKRDGIDLPSAFTATVNAELPVGALAETLTVSGQAPVVDTQNVANRKQLSNQVLDAVPTGGRLPQSYTILVPGVGQPPESSAAGLPNSFVQLDLSFHGDNKGAYYLVDGFDIAHRVDGGAQLMVNQGVNQEIVVSAGSAAAEQQSGGVFTNVVPKDGGNLFRGQIYTHYTDDRFAGNNVSSDLSAKGISSKTIRQSWDFDPVFGGPLKKDKLWFLVSYRNTGSEDDSSIRYDKNPLDWVYTPDTSRPAASEKIAGRNETLRLTYQATPRNKFTVHIDNQPNDWYNRNIGGKVAPESSTWSPYVPQYLVQGVWKSPVSNKLLLEAGLSYTNTFLAYLPQTHDAYTGGAISPDPLATPATDLNTGITFRGTAVGFGMLNHSQSYRTRASASYVTGTHAFKVGFYNSNFEWAVDRPNVRPGDWSFNLRSGVPASVVLWNTSYFWDDTNPDMGIFAQDQWNVTHRLALNLGLRFDYFTTSSPATDVPANRWLPVAHFDAVDHTTQWKDLDPRIGGSFDVFGNGKTAIKASLSRYISIEDNSLARNVVPSNASVQSVTRTWNDANGNFVPDCVLTNPAANGECGVYQDLNFGKANPRATTLDPSVSRGWFNRTYNWETAVSLQHEVKPGVAVSAGYFRRTFGNLTVSQNTLTTPADFSPFCVTLPTDSRLPNGGGYQQCGYTDVSPAKTGLRQTNINLASNFGERTRKYTGIEFTVNARLGHGLQVSGGTSTGRIVQNNCEVVNSAQDLLFCQITPPYQTQVKFLGVVPLPWGIQASGSFSSSPGPEISATTYVVANSQVVGSLGRNLSTGATGTVTVPLEQAGTRYNPSINKVDTRFSKIIRFGTRRVTAGVDLFNIFNSAGVVQLNTTFGPNYLYPTQIISARYLRFSAQFDF